LKRPTSRKPFRPEAPESQLPTAVLHLRGPIVAALAFPRLTWLAKAQAATRGRNKIASDRLALAKRACLAGWRNLLADRRVGAPLQFRTSQPLY